MNKKGFTMVELLAIMVILAIVLSISIPSIISISKKTESNDDVIQTIYMATESYIYNNYDDFRILDNPGSSTQINAMDLINGNYLKSDIINPRTNKKFTSNDYILVTRGEEKEEDNILYFELQ